jgi:hypothetical protein
VYGERREPLKQLRDIERDSDWRRLVGEAPAGPLDSPIVPGGLPPSLTPSEDDVERITREGGDALVSYLCSRAFPLEIESSNVNYREWTYRDILKLPQEEQTLWHKACHDELQILKDRKVYEIMDRPANRKIIKN